MALYAERFLTAAGIISDATAVDANTNALGAWVLCAPSGVYCGIFVRE